SSRRRHTRCYRDWSSDVCSSDLVLRHHQAEASLAGSEAQIVVVKETDSIALVKAADPVKNFAANQQAKSAKAFNHQRLAIEGTRSEERRVGKECRHGGARAKDNN